MHTMHNTLNIVISCITKSWGGRELVAYRNAVWFAEKGHKIFVIADPDGELYNSLKKTGITLIPLTFSNYFDLKGMTAIYKIIKKNNIDIFHSHDARPMGTILPALLFFTKIPVIFTRHIYNNRKKKDIYHRLLFKRLDSIFAISKFIQKNMLDTYPVKINKVPVVYNGVDTFRFKPDPDKRKIIRDKFKLTENDFVVGFMGRLDKAKGVLELISAFHKWVIEEDVSQKLLIVGEETRNSNDEFRKTIKNMISDLSLSSKVILSGFSDEPENELKAMDLFIMPSWKESFGMVATEAMCSKLPVIISDSGSADEIVSSNQYGLTFKTKNIDSLKDKISFMYHNDIKRNEYAQKGYKYATDHFSKENHVNTTLGLYYKLIKEKR